MKYRCRRVHGHISENGRLSLEMNALTDFLQANKNKSVFVEFEVFPEDATAAQKSYYYNGILKDIQEAFFKNGDTKSLEEIDKWLCGQSIYTKKETIENNIITTDRKSVRSLSKDEMYWFMFDVMQIAANLNISIKPPYLFTKKIKS